MTDPWFSSCVTQLPETQISVLQFLRAFPPLPLSQQTQAIQSYRGRFHRGQVASVQVSLTSALIQFNDQMIDLMTKCVLIHRKYTQTYHLMKPPGAWLFLWLIDIKLHIYYLFFNKLQL